MTLTELVSKADALAGLLRWAELCKAVGDTDDLDNSIQHATQLSSEITFFLKTGTQRTEIP